MTTWLVTGANRGIGLELVRQLVARDARVIATARELAGAAELCALPVRVETLDLADPDSVRRFTGELDGAPIDVLLNNAGIGGGDGGIDRLNVDDVAHYLAVNAIGPLRLTQALLPNLRAGSRRLIASMSSRMGSIADNTSGGWYGYRASKAALNMLNRTLAEELGREGFTCVVLHPGWVQTAMGGRGAPLAVTDSVAGLLAVLDRLGPADSGRFVDHEGRDVPY